MKDRTDRNEILREALRRGDPAAEEAGLTPEEIQAMRRTVLSAVPPPRERFRLVPAFVTAAAVILSFVVILSLWRTQEHPPAPHPPTPSPIPSPRPGEGEKNRDLSLAREGAPLSRRTGGDGRGDGGEGAVRPHRPARASVLAQRRPAVHPRSVPPEETADTPTRQVQFSTPGGTRVIWMLPQTTR
jgi:hypothetical protein